MKNKIIKTKLGWIGLKQTRLNWKNCFAIHWQFINGEKEFGFVFLGISNICSKNRTMLSFHCYNWKNVPKQLFVSFGILFLPHLELYIGNKKTWFNVSCGNYQSWLIKRTNIKSSDLFPD